MSDLPKGILPPDTENDFFIGWAKAPAIDRRFLTLALPAALITATGLGAAIVNSYGDPGAGSWDTANLHKVSGTLVMNPYPMLLTPDASSPSGIRSVLIVAQGKCTSALTLGAKLGQAVSASGALIQRKHRQMLEVPLLLGDWLEADTTTPLSPPALKSLGMVDLAGTIMDSKCFFGVMRPARGKTHKACAALCIRGGIPPSFWVRTKSGEERILLMTDAKGERLNEEILPLVADPVRVTGELVQAGDLLQLRADAAAFRRV